jgi:hypothetical protein
MFYSRPCGTTLSWQDVLCSDLHINSSSL